MAVHTISIDSDGSGDGSGSFGPLFGYLEAVKIAYGGTPAATTDVTVQETGGLARSLLTLTNANTNDTFYPRAEIDTTAGVGISAQYDRIFVEGPVTVTLAQAVVSTSDAITISIQITGS